MPDVEEFSAEETAAMEAMQQDNEPVTQEEQEAAQSAPEPAPEPSPAAEPTPEPVKPPEGYVPHSAMHQEREQRKAAEARLRDLEAQLAAAQPKPAEPDMPDPILDPVGFREYQRTQIKAQEDRWAAMENQRRQQVQEQQLISTVQSREAEFVKANPDYEAAVTHLRQARVEELRLYGATDDQIGQQIAQETRQLVISAMQQGRNPAEVAYQAAKMRGYNAAPPAPVVPAADPAKMQALAKAQANSGTLSTAGGPAVVGEYTVEMLANMSESEYNKLDKATIAKVMGA